jgi:hypothetical protein
MAGTARTYHQLAELAFGVVQAKDRKRIVDKVAAQKITGQRPKKRNLRQLKVRPGPRLDVPPDHPRRKFIIPHRGWARTLRKKKKKKKKKKKISTSSSHWPRHQARENTTHWIDII